MAFLPWVSSLNTLGNVEASVSPILQCLLKQTYNTTTSVPKKQKKKTKYRERERVLLLNTRKRNLGLFLDWVFHGYGSMAVGCLCFFRFFYSFYFWSQRKKIRDFLGENGSNYTKLKIYSSINTWGSFIVHFYFLMRNSIR